MFVHVGFDFFQTVCILLVCSCTGFNGSTCIHHSIIDIGIECIQCCKSIQSCFVCLDITLIGNHILGIFFTGSNNVFTELGHIVGVLSLGNHVHHAVGRIKCGRIINVECLEPDRRGNVTLIQAEGSNTRSSI